MCCMFVTCMNLLSEIRIVTFRKYHPAFSSTKTFSLTNSPYAALTGLNPYLSCISYYDIINNSKVLELVLEIVFSLMHANVSSMTGMGFC